MVKFTKVHFFDGLILSVPMSILLIWGFSGNGPSDANNSVSLVLMAIMLLITLPGSAILFILGVWVAFNSYGKGDHLFLAILFSSVVNAHFMGMIYSRNFFKK